MKKLRAIKPLSHQRGYLAVLAILLILVIGFIATAMIGISSGSSMSVADYHQGEQALYIAEAGFEEAARLLLTPNLSGSNSRIGCSAITGNSNLTNTTFGSGTFTATAVTGNPVHTNTTLSSAITSTASTIPVASTSGFASAGRIVIDREVINYGGISGNSFVGVQRGANETYNTPHASGAPVSQFQCMIDVKGGIPNLTSPIAQREIQQAMQLQEGWIAGSLVSGKFVFARWNYPTAVAWTDASLTSASAVTLNGISLLSNADGWAVGNAGSANFTLLHWNGASWSASTLVFACSNQNLAGVSAVYSNEAWAVGSTYKSTGGACTGAGGTRRYTVLHWNGASWSELTPATTPSIPADATTNQNLNAVHVIDATQSGAGTIGFAVGVSGKILQYNGTNWVAATSPTTNTLYGVYVVSATEAWAVGAAGTIIKYNGTSWSTVTSGTTNALYAVSMLDSNLSGTANTGWAVGASGTSVHYNGSTWSTVSTGTSNTLYGVALFFNSVDAWAVGAAGTIIHWNGSAWSTVTSPETVQLNAISLIPPQQFPFAWQEIYA